MLILLQIQYLHTIYSIYTLSTHKIIKIDLSKVEEYARRYMEEREFKPEQLREGTFKTVSTCDVRKVILQLQNTGAKGRDQISTLVLKRFAWTLAPPLRKIVNMSLEHCKYPEDWKEGKISPLPKGTQDQSLVKNWRPIVINCSASKVLEKIVNKQLGKYLEDLNLSACVPSWKKLFNSAPRC